MNDKKTNKIMSSEELDDVLPKYEPIKLSGKNLAQNYVSAFNTGMNIYQCVNYLQGNIDLTIKAVNDVVKSWNTEVSESIDQSKAIVRETTTEQFNVEWTNKQPELIEQVNTLTTNQFNNEKSIFNDELNTLNARMDTFSNHNLLINPDFKINQRGDTSYEQQGYSVDRWKIWNVTVTPNANGGITVKNDKYTDNGTFIQILENATEADSTLSCYVTLVSGTVTMVADDNSQVVLKQGLNVVHTSNSTKNFTIFLNQGASITLKWVKLEQGKVATAFIAPNMAEEIIKCKRYFQALNVFEGFVGSVSYWNLYTKFYVGAMRTTSPTIISNVSSATINLSGNDTETNLQLSNNISPTMYLNELIITHKSATNFGYNAFTACIFRSAITYNVDAEIY